MRNNMRGTAALLVPLLLTLSLGLAARSGTGAPLNALTNEVDMGPSNFVQPSRTINAGENIHFVDEQSGATHVICLGRDGNCNTSAKGSQPLTGQGSTIQPGQMQDVRFDEAGVYAITCPIHPSMNLLITVQ